MDGSQSSIISIHALLAESDLYLDRQNPKPGEFLSTLSLRRATREKVYKRTVSLFLSTLSLRRATKTSMAGRITSSDFYPRSPCGERPCITTTTIGIVLFLSTLSLRRATLPAVLCRILRMLFLSTLSLRRATCLSIFKPARAFYFYPRSPCGERL